MKIGPLAAEISFMKKIVRKPWYQIGLNLVLFIIYIFRKFESNISKGREAMAPRLYQSEATHNLMNLRIILLKFSENVYVEKH